MFQWHVFGLAFGEDAFYLSIEVIPFIWPPKIIYHHESTVGQILAERRDFFPAKYQSSWFNHVQKWIVEKFWIRQINNNGVWVYF